MQPSTCGGSLPTTPDRHFVAGDELFQQDALLVVVPQRHDGRTDVLQPLDQALRRMPLLDPSQTGLAISGTESPISVTMPGNSA